MTREEKVQWLVTNRAEWNGEEGSEILNALSPTRIDTIFDQSQAASYFQQVANLAADGFVHNNAAYKFDPDQGSFVVNECADDMEEGEYDAEGNPIKKKEQMATNSAPMTLNEMYERGDSQVRGMIDTWKEHDARVRHESLVRLTNNCKSDEAKNLTANSLNKLSTRELQQMADAVHTPQDYNPRIQPRQPSYVGASGAPVQTTNADLNDVLALPTTNYDDSASSRLIQHMKNGR